MSERRTRRPRSPALLEEMQRYTWLAERWKALPPESRDRYDEWVSAAPSPRVARRRAALVVRRCYGGRPWANRVRRWTQAVRDYAPEQAPGERGTTPEVW